MSDTFITPQALLSQWQGHRRLTRRVIQAFPDEHLFTYSVAGMRPFGALAMEMVGMTAPMVRGVITGKWDNVSRDVKSRDELLGNWDHTTEELERLWPRIPASKFAETITAFGMFTDATHNLILYVIDNEIHHRGQGYVYLRTLGITPPPFYER
jgi:uncharacterized damage-inducible protein DinB